MFVLLGGTPALAKKAATDRLPEGRLTLLNVHIDEKLTVTYRTRDGEYDHEALSEIDRVLRCHYTNEVARIDIRTIEFLNRIDKKLGGGNEIRVISGYRSPAYNRNLRQEGRNVAKQSLHMKGKAIDISIPHVGTDTVRRTALKLGKGGVGYYPASGFVHIDSGPFRTW
jgi:uncharacterized protein YcbK (DUF882 family)